MSILSNINHILDSVRATQNKPPRAMSTFMPWPYVDTMFDFTQIIGSDPIAWNIAGKRVGIVGAGAAGLCAAYELLRAGATPIVYEASNRIGGRAYSSPFMTGSSPLPAFAELGSMRVPPSQRVFNIYAARFGMTSIPFPDPGKVQTRLYYENQAYDWTPSSPPPGPFQQLAIDFDNWIDTFSNVIMPPWQQGNLQQVQLIWQTWINKYRDVSFYQAVVEGIPQWTAEDLNAFGALGLGSGGFGPLYEVGMLEMLRIILQGWEDNQQLYQQGMTALCTGFYTAPVGPGGQSLESLGYVLLNMPVSAVYSQGNVPWIVPKNQSPVAFDAVIVATTTRSMEQMGLTMPFQSTPAVLQQGPRVALRDLHMTSSSKYFLLTQNKFWKNQPATFPLNIQTDELARGVYALDYPQTDNGVVLLSYTWEDDSIRLQGLDPETRYQTLVNVVSQIAPEWAPYIQSPIAAGQVIDWQSMPNYYGGFKLNYPGQEAALQQAYYQFLSVLSSGTDTGIYLAGDGISYSGGWTEGALHTGLNAATAAAKRCGGSLPTMNALSMQSASLYDYGGPVGTNNPGPPKK